MKTHTLETHPNKGNVTVYQGKAGDWIASRYGVVARGRTKAIAKARVDAAILEAIFGSRTKQDKATQANTTRT